MRLKELAGEGIDHASVGQRRVALDTSLLENVLEENIGLVGVQLVSGRELLAGELLESGNHLDAAPGTLPVDGQLLALGVVVLGDVRAVDVLDKARDELLGHAHEVVHVGVGHVKLEGGELGVVGEIDRLVTELTAHLVDAVEATDDKHLEVQLGGDTQEHVHVEVVVVGDEGLGGGTSGNDVEHGGLDRDEVAVIEPTADVRVDLGAGDEDVASLVVHHEIKVALAEALLGVLEAVMVVGDLVQAGGQKNHLTGSDRQLAREVASALLVLGVGTRGVATDTDDIATAQVNVLLLEVRGVGVSVFGLRKDLQTDTLGIVSISANWSCQCAWRPTSERRS